MASDEEIQRERLRDKLLDQQTQTLKATRKVSALMVAATLVVAIGTFMQGSDGNTAEVFRGIMIILTSLMLLALFFIELSEHRKG